ncbi:MAG: MFS transporter [Actinomycetia bacterium]|nr:MFS transporter [Actinomycetes bacterium]
MSVIEIPRAMLNPIVRVRRRTTRYHLLRVRDVRHFVALIAVGNVAGAISTLALAQVVVFQISHGASRATIAQALLAMSLPSLVAAPLAGIACDRWDRRRVLRDCHIGRAVLTAAAVAVPILGSSHLGFILTSVLLGLTAMTTTTRATALPHMVDPDQLLHANSLLSVTAKVAGSTGFLVGAVLLWWSPITALLFAAALQASVALGWTRFAHDLGGRCVVGAHHCWSGAARRIARLATSGPTRRAIITSATLRAATGGAFVSLLLWVDARLDVSAAGYAVVLSVAGTGSLIGTLITPLVAGRLGRRTTVSTAFVLSASTCLLAGVLPMEATVVAAAFTTSLVMQVVRLLADSTVQRAIADDALGRVYSLYEMSYTVAFLIGALGLLALNTSMPSTRFLIVSAVAVLGALGQCWPPLTQHHANTADLDSPTRTNPFRRSPRRVPC